LPKPLCGRSGPAEFSTAFTDSHPACFFPRGRPDRCCKPYDTAFDRFAPVSPDRILGLHATPVPRSGTVLPNLSSGSCCDNRPCEQLFRLSSTPIARFDFPRLLDSCRRTFNLTVSQGHTGQVIRLASSLAACSGLQATPVDFARQRILTAYHPVSGIPAYSTFFGSFPQLAPRVLDRPIEPCGFA